MLVSASAFTVYGVGRRTLMPVSTSALTVHEVGHRSLMLVSASALIVHGTKDSDAGECFRSYSPWSWT